MEQENFAAVVYGIEDLRLEKRPIPTFRDDQVLLKMDTVGICGTDIHFLANGEAGHYKLHKPMVTGHESSAVVYKVGKAVKNVKAGDRVAVEPGIPCRFCHYCKHGQYNICPDKISNLVTDGNLSTYFAHPADLCHKLPDHVTMEEGAILEPLACAVHACRRANIAIGKNVLILGAGPIGLLTVIAAKAMGAENILITDVVPDRLGLARELGATHTLHAKNGVTEMEMKERIHAEIGEPHVTMECSGAQTAVRLAIYVTKPGGCVCLVGIGKPEMTVPLVDALLREVDIRGSFCFANDYPAALALVAAGNSGVSKLITHHFDFTETQKAFDTARANGKNGAIKVMIHCAARDENNFK